MYARPYAGSEAAQLSIPKTGVSPEEGIFFLPMCDDDDVCVCFHRDYAIGGTPGSINGWPKYRKWLIFLFV